MVLYMPIGYYTIHPDQWSSNIPHFEDISINYKDIEPLAFSFIDGTSMDSQLD